MSDPIIDPAHAIPAASALRRSRFRWRILAFVALVVAVLAVGGRYATENGLTGDQIARVVIDGTIATDPSGCRCSRRSPTTTNVKAVVIAINSPGGTTAGGEELYEAIGKLRAKKPVVAYIKEAGRLGRLHDGHRGRPHLRAAAVDRRLDRRAVPDLQRRQADATPSASVSDKVASGPLKAEPDIDHPMTPEVRASMQSLVDDSFSWFVDIVAERRGLSRAEVLPLADGRILTGNQGIADKLVDEVGGEAEAIAWLEKSKGIKADLPVAHLVSDRSAGLRRHRQMARRRRRVRRWACRPTVPSSLDGLVSLWQVAS